MLVLAVFLIGVIFFRLHSLPERLGHKKLQFEIVAVLALLSLFTHIHLFWVTSVRERARRRDPGSRCIANAYMSNHDRLTKGNVGAGTWLFLHAVDAVGRVHAMLLRIQALVLPIQTLVFAGH